MKALNQMVCRVLRILSSIAALSLAGCLMHGPYGYDSGAYPYSPQGSGAMIQPSGSSPYVTQPGPVYSGTTSQPPYYPSSNYPYPSSSYSSTPSPGGVPNTGSTIPQPSSTPFSSNPPIKNSDRPLDRLPPDDGEYPDTPPRKPVTSTPPNISDALEVGEEDFKADQGGKPVAPKSNVQEYIDELDKEGEIPGDAARKDGNLKQQGAFFDDEGDEFAPPTAFVPGEEVKLTDEEFDDPALFMRKGDFYRGKVSFDDVEQRWYLQYEPVADPETGEGIVYLAEYPKLTSLRNNTRVVIEGRLDNKQLDQFDRPILVIKNMSTIVPNGNP